MDRGQKILLVRGRKLAHVFDDGWDEGTFQGRTKDDHLFFYYKTDKTKFSHSLLLFEDGVTKLGQNGRNSEVRVFVVVVVCGSSTGC